MTSSASNNAGAPIPDKLPIPTPPAPAVGSTSIQIPAATSPQPFKIQLEGQTDWPIVIATLAVGIGSIVTSLVVGFMAASSQRAAIQSGVSELKSDWIRELRQAISRFAGLAGQVLYAQRSKANSPEVTDDVQVLGELRQAQCQVLLLIGQNHADYLGIDVLMDEITESARIGDAVLTSDLVEKLLQASQATIKKAWEDVHRSLLHVRGGREIGGKRYRW